MIDVILPTKLRIRCARFFAAKQKNITRFYSSKSGKRSVKTSKICAAL